MKFENLSGGMRDVIWTEVSCPSHGAMELRRYAVVDVTVVEA